MKFASWYLVGYVLFLAGVGAALWKMGVIQNIGAGWTAIGFVIAVGIGCCDRRASSDRDRTL